jgi:ATP-dependent DNA helicase DinG
LTAGLPAVLREAATLLDSALRRALDLVGDVKVDDADPVRKQQAKAGLGELSDTAQRLLAEAEHDVAWVEKDDRGRRALVVAPLSVAGTLATHLYADRTVIATSATLALGGQFETMARALGLTIAAAEPGGAAATHDRAGADTRERAGEAAPEADPPGEAAAEADPARTAGPAGQAGTAGPAGTARAPNAAGPARTAGPADSTESPAEARSGPAWRALDVGSPFEYARQGILYVAAHLPRPTTSGLSEAAAEELVRLVHALGGRTLGLFSSRRAAERAAEVLRARTDLVILLQGEEALPLLVRRFRAERNSCLLGVMSLWQGVDVPGDACQLVVIDRLPFPRPDEPLAAARAAAVDAAGGSGFASVSVPIAAVRLAQGAGRLIRSRTDRGVVAVLDSRLETARGYGSYLRRSLPPFWYTTKPEAVLGALARLRAG